MLSAVIKEVEERSDALRSYLSLCEICDVAISSATGTLYQMISDQGAASKNPSEDKILRHCNVVIQSYGLYEWCVETVLSIWLTSLPKYQAFSDLSEPFKKSYRVGIGRIIGNIEMRRYRNLDLSGVATKFADALNESSPWELIHEALTFHSNNLRKNDLDALLNPVGLTGIWDAIETYEAFRTFSTTNDTNATLEQLVLELVDFRNDAAHGRPDEILGIEALRQRIDFVEVFCLSLSNIVTHRLVKEQVKHSPETEIGKVTEVFSNNIIIATCKSCQLEVGQSVYFLRDIDCRKGKIESLQVNDVDNASVEVLCEPVEIGIKTSIPVARNASIVLPI